MPLLPRSSAEIAGHRTSVDNDPKGGGAPDKGIENRESGNQADGIGAGALHPPVPDSLSPVLGEETMTKYVFVLACWITFSSLGFAQANQPSPLVPPVDQTAISPRTHSTHWSVHAKNVAQVLFWIAIGTVAILGYLGAKKTILQPIRTEIFKVHLKEMRTILSMFVGKGEIELRQTYAFDKLLMANMFMMYDEYVKTFFDVEMDREKRPYCSSECPSSIFTQEGMDKHVRLLDDHVQKEFPDPSEQKKDPRVRAALWAEYEQYNLCIPKEFSEQERKMQDLVDNPLLSSECVDLLTEYTKTVHENAERLRKLLTECAKEMPTKYPSFDTLKSGAFGWIKTRFNNEFCHLKPKAEAIIAFVRSCYNVDNLLNT